VKEKSSAVFGKLGRFFVRFDTFCLFKIHVDISPDEILLLAFVPPNGIPFPR
tara:strand:- start:17 stop:172 length:156 start_codon:yes stop_codon:yes gene_type:complete